MKKSNDGGVGGRGGLNVNNELFHGKFILKFNDDGVVGDDMDFLDTGKCLCLVYKKLAL